MSCTRPRQLLVPVPVPDEPDPDEPLSVPVVPVPDAPEELLAPDASLPPGVPAAPVPVEESPVPDAPLVAPGQKQEAASVPEVPEVVAPAAPDVIGSDALEVVAPDAPLAPLVVNGSLVLEVPLDSAPPTGVWGIKVPCEPSAQVQLVLELLPEVPVAPLAPEVVEGSVEEPDVAAPLAGSEGDVPLIPDPPLVTGSLLPEVALPPVAVPPPEVVLLSDAPLVVPYVLAPDVDG